MLNEKANTPKGVGVGSLFSGLIREIIPVSKSTIENLNKVIDNKSMKLMEKTLQKEATNTAINDTLKFMKQKKIKKSKKKQLKKVAKNILTAAKHKKSSALSKSKKSKKNILSTTKHKKSSVLSTSKKSPQKNILSINRKRKLKQDQGPKNKKPLIDDDDY